MDINGKTQNFMMQGSVQTADQEPDINQVQIDNLFNGGNSFAAQLSYTDYCAIT